MPVMLGWQPDAMRFATVAGLASNTTCALADEDGNDIATDDIVVAVIRRAGDSALPVGGNLKGEAQVPAAGQFKLTTTVTTGDVLEIWWVDVSV